MSGVFKRSAAMVRKSGMVVVIWVISLVVTFIGASYFCEDFMTSVKGYRMVPTHHHYDWIIWIGALTPQVGLVFFAYLGADQPDRWWAWLCSAALLLVDSATDLLFKHIPGNPTSVAASVIEILIMYNLCSEGFLVLGSGLVLELFPDAVAALRNLKSRLVQSSGSWGMLGKPDRSPGGPARGRPSPPTQSHVLRPKPRGGSYRPPAPSPGLYQPPPHDSRPARIW